VSDTLDAQIARLVELGYPAFFGLDDGEFAARLEPLRDIVPASESEIGSATEGHSVGASEASGDAQRDAAGSSGHVSFVLVIESPRAPAELTLPLIERRGKNAIERLYPHTPQSFSAIEEVKLPDGEAYLLIDVDRGADTLNVTPNDAFATIAARGRAPLTIAEGIALLTHYPEFLQPNECFSLLASRAGDKRVPALWLSEKRPKLGWCWAGNPHTWLGSASAATRIGAAARGGLSVSFQ